MKPRKKFVNLVPISKEAKYRFFTSMDCFHGCEVKEEKDEMLFLQSINGQYLTWVPKKGNIHWEVVK